MEQVVSSIVGGAVLAGIGLAQSAHIFAGKKEKEGPASNMIQPSKTRVGRIENQTTALCMC